MQRGIANIEWWLSYHGGDVDKETASMMGLEADCFYTGEIHNSDGAWLKVENEEDAQRIVERLNRMTWYRMAFLGCSRDEAYYRANMEHIPY